MNFKLLFPSYRTRYRFVTSALEAFERPARLLNLGTGEGELDGRLRELCGELHACDVNAADIAHARALNGHIPGIHYSVEDGEALRYASSFFDAVVCMEVIEHVPHPTRLVAEIARVLRPGGRLILTCPSVDFPATYDPVNRALQAFDAKLPIGAFGYGHDWLVKGPVLRSWLVDAGFDVATERHLSKPLVGLLECYWPGLLQKTFKSNAANTGGRDRVLPSLRPTTEAPPFARWIDRLIDADDSLFPESAPSIGLGVVATRR